MKKRVLALLLVIVMIAGLAVGCGKSPAATNDAPANSSAPANNEEAQPAASGEKLEGTLNIFQFKVEINDALVAATKRYMELNPGVKVNLETVGGGDDYGAAQGHVSYSVGSILPYHNSSRILILHPPRRLAPLG